MLFTSYLIHLVLTKILDHYSAKKESEQTEEISDKMQKPLWFKINKAEFDELTGYIYNNQDNNDFKITIKKVPYNLKKAKEFWTKVSTRKITEGDAKS